MGLTLHSAGHVLGLMHEHQRPDADKWLDFKCASVTGYSDTKKKVDQQDVDTMEQVCTNGKLAS
jgi:hypothetical protein